MSVKLPPAFQWLANISPLPRMVAEWIKILGTTEAPGAANNPTIMQWADEVGVDRIGWRYTEDSIPWCGLAMAVVALRAGKVVPGGPLRALNWQTFGRALTPIEEPSLGDALVMNREGGGHVCTYLAEGRNRQGQRIYWGVGGNQRDSVRIDPFLASRVVAVRRPIYRNQPASVRPYIVTADAELSTNEV